MNDEAIIQALVNGLSSWTHVGKETDTFKRLAPRAKEALASLRSAGWDIVHTTDHYVDISANGWAIQHATYCRPNMLDCDFTKAAQRWTSMPAESGRYLALLDGPDLPPKLVSVPIESEKG